jgi:hypothetical protein
MTRAALVGLAIGLAIAGCGREVDDPGDPHARRVLSFAAHARSLEDRTGAAGRALLTDQATPRETRLALGELLGQVSRLREDAAATVPFGVPGRVPTLDAALELLAAARFLHSYASGHAGALELARTHIDGAARALAGAAGALEPSLTPADAETLAHLRAPPPELP